MRPLRGSRRPARGAIPGRQQRPKPDPVEHVVGRRSGGRVTRRRREPLPAGGHTPQHITPNPQAVRIPRGPAPSAILPYLMDHTERDDLATEINRRTQA